MSFDIEKILFCFYVFVLFITMSAKMLKHMCELTYKRMLIQYKVQQSLYRP
jgi:hypothetical protein